MPPAVHGDSNCQVNRLTLFETHLVNGHHLANLPVPERLWPQHTHLRRGTQNFQVLSFRMLHIHVHRSAISVGSASNQPSTQPRSGAGGLLMASAAESAAAFPPRANSRSKRTRGSLDCRDQQVVLTCEPRFGPTSGFFSLGESLPLGCLQHSWERGRNQQNIALSRTSRGTARRCTDSVCSSAGSSAKGCDSTGCISHAFSSKPFFRLPPRDNGSEQAEDGQLTPSPAPRLRAPPASGGGL